MQPVVNFSNSQFPTNSGEFCRDFSGHNTRNNVMSYETMSSAQREFG